MTLLRCSRCTDEKPADDFSPASNSRGRNSWCKPCAAEYARTRYRRRPEVAVRQRDRHLQRYYGISLTEFEAMVERQDGLCAVCRHPQKWNHSQGKGQWHVDHDHRTGRVRGLLCHKCNVALGMVGDSVDRLRALIAYLQREVP